jgi:integrase-like protein
MDTLNGGGHTGAFDAIFEDEGIAIVKTGIRVPRMNAIMERWVRSCRAELLDRTLIVNQAHLRHALHEYQTSYNEHRTARSTPRHHCARCPNRSPDRTGSTTSTSTDMIDSAVSSTSTDMPLDLRGRDFGTHRVDAARH